MSERATPPPVDGVALGNQTLRMIASDTGYLRMGDIIDLSLFD